jgi:nucleoside-diphosphate-sugar epimerase
LGSTYRDFYIP